MENIDTRNETNTPQPTPIEVTRVEVDLHRKDLESQLSTFRRKGRDYAQELWQDGRGVVRTSGQFLKAWFAVTKKQARRRLKLAA